MTTSSDSPPINTPSSEPAVVVSEPAWPPAAAVLLLIVLNLILRLTLHSNRGHVPGWLIPTLEGALLIVLVVRSPTTTGRRGAPLRRASIALVWLLVAASLWATSVLVFAMVRGRQGDAVGRHPPCLRRLRLDRQQRRVRASFLGVRWWRTDHARLQPPPLPRPRLHPTPEPRACPTGLETDLLGLSPSWLHQQPRLQPDRRAAARPLDEARDERSSRHLGRHPRPRYRESGQHLQVTACRVTDRLDRPEDASAPTSCTPSNGDRQS